MKVFLTISIVFFCGKIFSQNIDSIPQGHITVVQDSMIQLLLDKHIAFNKSEKKMPGFRIQITASSNRQQVLNLKAQCLAAFPDLKAYVIYTQPYYKLRLGDFMGVYDASKDLKRVKEKFEGAFLVPDEISISNQ